MGKAKAANLAETSRMPSREHSTTSGWFSARALTEQRSQEAAIENFKRINKPDIG